MYFKRIEMMGFKSFAQPVCIEFHPGITCIVGPNGSGKSNVSDAIRWVLGEQSPKTLRGGKMEEVIFAGTQTRKSKGIAEVTIVIDNQDGFLPIDYAEVALTRKMYRSGESEYFINQNQCRLKDVKELIMDTGMGIDGYSIIGQGKISEIVSNKTQGRRELFEEAAGIIKYRVKKAQTERKLEATHGNLERVNDIVSELEGRIDGLREDSEKAKEYLTLKEEYKTKEINITLKSIESIELKTEYLKDDLLETENEIQRKKEEKTFLEEDILNNKEELKNLENQIQQARQNELETINAQSAVKSEIQLGDERLFVMQRDTARLQTEIERMTGKYHEQEMNLTQLEKQHHEDMESFSKIQLDLESKNVKNMDISEKMAALAEAMQEKRNTIFALYRKVTEGKTENLGLQSLKESLKRRKEEIDREETAAKEMITGLQKQIEEAAEQSSTMENKLCAVNEELEEERKLFQTREESLKKQQKQLQDMRNQIESSIAKKTMMEELDSAYEGYSYAVKLLMQNKDAIGGIIGTVGDILTVPKEFAVAIETVLAGSMQNLVCTDDAAASKGIALLKERKGGRATFLPLGSIKPFGAFTDPKVRKALGFMGTATELLQFEKKYENIVSYLLGNVILVDSLEHAVKLSKNISNGIRMVTPEGDMMNQRGAMTGGANKSGSGNILHRKAQMKDLEAWIEELECQKEMLKGQVEKTEEVYSRQKSKLIKQKEHKSELQASLNDVKNQLVAMEKQWEVLKGSEQRGEKEKNNIAVETSATQNLIDTITKQVEENEKSIQAFEVGVESIMALYDGCKVNHQESLQEINNLKLAAARAETQRKSYFENALRMENAIKELQEDKKGNLEELNHLKEQKLKLILQKEENAKQMEQLALKQQSLQECFSLGLEQKNRTQQYIDEIVNKRESLDGEIYHVQLKKNEIQVKITKNQESTDHLKNKLWEDFELSYIQAMAFGEKEFPLGSAQKEVKILKDRIKALGEVNVGAVKEFEQVNERFLFLSEQRNDLQGSIGSLRMIIEEMDQTIKVKFKESFEQISENFELIFKELYGGGSAELRLEDPENILESGIEIIAQPPGKKLQNINLLSGGEKSLTAIALMCGVLKVKPTPFCILDEVEAALDDVNISRFVTYLRNFKEIQFVLVTHQKATMEQADVMYGITMPEQGISKVVSLKLGEAWNQ